MFFIDTANFARQLLPPIYDDQLRNGALEKLLVFFLNKIAPMIKQIGDTRDLGLFGYGIQNKRLVEAILRLYGILAIEKLRTTNIEGSTIFIDRYVDSLKASSDAGDITLDVDELIRQLDTKIRRDFAKITPQGIPIELKITK